MRHIRSSEIYWYCSHCHQEMPVLEAPIKEPINLSDLPPSKDASKNALAVAVHA